MKPTLPVDFETFYFIKLMETIQSEGKSRLKEPLLGPMAQFVDFLLSGEEPLKHIEDLARLPQTSDLSIFFSDLLERLPEINPEKAMNDCPDYAGDFLDIFSELAKDPEWNNSVMQPLLGKTLAEEEIDLVEFVKQEVPAALRRMAPPWSGNEQQLLVEFTNRLRDSENPTHLCEDYKDQPELAPLVDSLIQIYSRPTGTEKIEDFIASFYSRIKEIKQSLEKLAGNMPEVFAAFCRGARIPETPVAAEQPDKMSEMIEKAKQLEALAANQTQLLEEDRQLRWLLRDYIIHEVESLGEELREHLSAIDREPAEPEHRENVLNVLKVLKDLGQIHKYNGIESTSTRLLKKLQPQLVGNQRLPQNLTALLGKLDSDYQQYIETVLSNSESEGLAILQKLESEIEAQLGAPAVEEKISFSNRSLLNTIFSEVNNRFLTRITHNWEQFLDQPDNDAVLESLADDLGHLGFWYRRLELSDPLEIISVLQNWIDGAEPLAIFEEKKSEIKEAFTALAGNLFETPPDEWLAIRNRLIGVAEVDIEHSVDAFREVTLRQLNGLHAHLQKPALSETDAQKYSQEVVKKIATNCRLVKNEDLLAVCEVIGDLLKEEPAVTGEPFFEWLLSTIELIVPCVEQLPEKIQSDKLINEISRQYRSLALPQEQETVEKETGDVTGREEYIDDELRQVFDSEARKYLEEIEKQLSDLEKNPQDRDALKKAGDVTHTLRGSAQMLNQTPIAELAAPLEEAVETILEGKTKADVSLLPIYRDFVNEMRQRLDGEATDTNPLLERLNDYLRAQVVEELPEEIREETPAEPVLEEVAAEEPPEPEEETPPAVEEGVPMLRLAEQDPELLDIFRNEAQTNLQTIENELNLIEKFTYDKKALQSMDQAIHEVRAAAKMLGFSEIGDLTDTMEQVVDRLSRKEPEDWRNALPALRKATLVIRELSEKLAVPLVTYESAIQAVKDALEAKAVEEPETEKPKAKEPEAEQAEAPTKTDILEPTSPVIEAFLQETREYLEDINVLLMKLEKQPDDGETAYNLLRSLHTLKGSAAMVYVEPVEKMAHGCEDILEKVHEQKQPVTQEAIDLLFEVLDEIEYIVDRMSSGLEGKTRNYQSIMPRLEKLSGSKPAKKAAKKKQPGRARAASKTKAEKEEEFLQIADEPQPAKPATRDAYVRLHVNQMDNLLNEAAELVINHTQFKTQLDKFKNYLPRMDMEGKNLQNILWFLETIINEQNRILELTRPYVQNVPAIEESQKNQIENIKRTIKNLQVFYNNLIQTVQGIKESGKLYEEQVHKITRLSTQIHEEIMEARLVPIALLFQRFHRPLRDLARSTKKKVKVYMEGESTELDRALIEELYEPLLHILRNAVDHGIETPAKRKKLGKAEEGIIQISATQERNFVTVEIKDDGQGIDLQKVKRKAVQLEILDSKQAKNLSDDEVYELLMYPGFSTARKKTRLSGRGVGLDVVRNQLQKLKGDIRIYSRKGEGSRFLIRVPISLTVTQAMLVEVSGHIYAIPLMQVEETIKVSVGDLELKDGVYYLKHRGLDIPMINLANLLQIRGAKRKPVTVGGEYPAIVVQDEGKKVALLMEKIVHREEILIKGLGPSLEQVTFITGGSVLADGRVVLVLDVAQIVREAARMKETGVALNPEDLVEASEAEEATDKSDVKKRREKRIVEGRKPAVLVVDDSLSIRKFLSGLLTQNGYDVEIAKHGYDAMEKLNERNFDLLVTDLEMPHLSGYELIEQIRSDTRWSSLPIIVLTGRASKHIRKLSMDLGADEFVIKPFKEEELLEKISSFVKV